MEMRSLKIALKRLFCKNHVLTIWCSDLQEAEDLWRKVYMLDGWDVKETISVKWNWKRFEYLFTFKVSKKLDKIK
jgi:hypothetical protein